MTKYPVSPLWLPLNQPPPLPHWEESSVKTNTALAALINCIVTSGEQTQISCINSGHTLFVCIWDPPLGNTTYHQSSYHPQSGSLTNLFSCPWWRKACIDRPEEHSKPICEWDLSCVRIWLAGDQTQLCLLLLKWDIYQRRNLHSSIH